MHYKNRKPKKFKGCCSLCCLGDSNGTRNGRLLTRQEKKARLNEKEQRKDN
jgi:hypothetical protein